MQSSMEAVFKGKGKVLNEPFFDEVTKVNCKLRLDFICNHKKVHIEEDDKSNHLSRRQDLRRTDQLMIGVKEEQQRKTGVVEDQQMTQLKEE